MRVKIDVKHVSAWANRGGAGKAAYRVLQSLEVWEKESIEASMLTVRGDETNEKLECKVKGLEGEIYYSLIEKGSGLARLLFKSRNQVPHHMALIPTSLGRKLRTSKNGLVHLHELGDSTLSIEQIGYLGKGVVWTLHDQWPLAGAEHYVMPPGPNDRDSTDKRYIEGYSKWNRPIGESGLDINRLTWKRKMHAWKQPIHLICTSEWMKRCAESSYVAGRWPIHLIPLPIDTDKWIKINQGLAREVVGCSKEAVVVGYCALDGEDDPRKGADLLRVALEKLEQEVKYGEWDNVRIELLVIGGTRTGYEQGERIGKRMLGQLKDEFSMVLAYNACDLMVVPSRQDTLTCVGMEAQACGVPVVAFDTAGLPCVVESDKTGLLVKPFCTEALYRALKSLINNEEVRTRMGREARERAIRLWSPKRVARMHRMVYEQVEEERDAKPQIR